MLGQLLILIITTKSKMAMATDLSPKEIGVKRITHMLSKAIGRDMHASRRR